MKNTLRFTFLLLMAATAFNVSAMQIQSSHSGSWYNPDQSGHGMNIEVLGEDTMVIYWFVYNPDGTPTFLVTLAGIDGDTATGKTYCYSGMKFGEFDPVNLKEEVWGTASITFESCDAATLNYDSTLDYEGTPFGDGSIDLSRLATVSNLACKDLPAQGNYDGRAIFEQGHGHGYISIQESGELAYNVLSSHSVESGYGQISMLDDESFTFEVVASDSAEGDRVYESTGTVDGNSIALDLGANGILYGTLFSSFQENLDLTDLAGSYKAVLGNYGVTDNSWVMPFGTFEITDEGALMGSNFFGCNYDGTISIPDPRFNQVDFQAELSGLLCGSEPIILQGLGQFHAEDDSIYLVIKIADTVVSWRLDRL